VSWIVSAVIGGAFLICGVAGLLTGADNGLVMIVGAGLWFKIAAIEKTLY
jgi:hypothetical protein